MRFGGIDSHDGENIYSPRYRGEMLEDDEISSWEAGFMEGYEEQGG